MLMKLCNVFMAVSKADDLLQMSARDTHVRRFIVETQTQQNIFTGTFKFKLHLLRFVVNVLYNKLYDKRWLGSLTVSTLDLPSRGRWFDSRSGRYQVVSTWMGDCLRTGKPPRYNQHQGQLSLLSLQSRYVEYQPDRLGLRRGVFTCVGWQITLYDPIWQVTLRSSEMGFP